MNYWNPHQITNKILILGPAARDDDDDDDDDEIIVITIKNPSLYLPNNICFFAELRNISLFSNSIILTFFFNLQNEPNIKHRIKKLREIPNNYYCRKSFNAVTFTLFQLYFLEKEGMQYPQ